MLTDTRLEQILGRIPTLTIGVLGDLFLDRYLDLDAALTELSIETGLNAYQVTCVRSIPGAAGTVINNLVALGAKRVCAVSIIGDDGEGYELRQALDRLRVVDASKVFSSLERRTPTYTKPMLHEAGQVSREVSRLDIKNRTPTPGPLQDMMMEAVHEIWPQLDALLVMDQVGDEDCGVVTARVRELLAQLADSNPEKFVMADSRERIGLYRSVWTKPNRAECASAVYQSEGSPDAVLTLSYRTGRPVFCTYGDLGIIVANPEATSNQVVKVAAYPVTGPLDIVGAGDSTSAGIGCAMAAGATLEEAAAFGNLVASITIQQIGTTGTATAEQVRQRWLEVRAPASNP